VGDGLTGRVHYAGLPAGSPRFTILRDDVLHSGAAPRDEFSLGAVSDGDKSLYKSCSVFRSGVHGLVDTAVVVHRRSKNGYKSSMNTASVLDTHSEKSTSQPPIRVAAFTGGRQVASARFRLRQFIEPLRRVGITIHEDYSLVSSYPPPVYGASRRLIQSVW